MVAADTNFEADVRDKVRLGLIACACFWQASLHIPAVEKIATLRTCITLDFAHPIQTLQILPLLPFQPPRPKPRMQKPVSKTWHKTDEFIETS